MANITYKYGWKNCKQSVIKTNAEICVYTNIYIHVCVYIN